jgi:hypothetical protein
VKNEEPFVFKDHLHHFAVPCSIFDIFNGLRKAHKNTHGAKYVQRSYLDGGINPVTLVPSLDGSGLILALISPPLTGGD